MAVLRPVTWVRLNILNPSTRNSRAFDSLNLKLRETRISKFTIFGKRNELRGTKAKRVEPAEPFWPPPGVEIAGPPVATLQPLVAVQLVGKLPDMVGV